MPFTFLAHQAPVLAIKRARPVLDGVAMAVGSAVPDMATATQKTTARYFLGHPLWWDGHSFAQQFSWCLPVGLVLTWLTRRLLAPRLAPYLSDVGPLHLRDLRFVSRTRHRWYEIVLCVLIGSFSHILIDGLTHTNGWGIHVFPFLGSSLTTVDGRNVSLASVLQVIATIGLGVWCIWELWLIGRERLIPLWAGVGLEERSAVDASAPRGRRIVRGVVAVIAVIAAGWAGTQFHRGTTIVIMTWAWLVLAGLCLVSLGVGLADRFAAVRDDQPIT